MSNELPYLPFFVSDFLVTVATWPPDRVGAYVLALFYQFEQGGLPADNEPELARILHVSRPVSRRLWREIASKFQRRDDGLWWNWRMEEVRSTARLKVANASARAKAGAVARWGKGANAQASRKQSIQSNPSTRYPPKGSRREPRTQPQPSGTRHTGDPYNQQQKTVEVKRLIAGGMAPAEAKAKVYR